MARQLTYADALKLLGEHDSEVLDLAEKLTDGGLGLVGVPNLFGVRGLLVGKGRKALEGLGDKIAGRSRLSRTERIQAAHKVLFLVSFFEAVAEYLTQWEGASSRQGSAKPFSLASLKITREEQWSFLDDARPVEPPTPPFVRTLQRSEPTSASLNSANTRQRFGILTQVFQEFLMGLPEAERHGLELNNPVAAEMVTSVSKRANELYQESYLRLAAEAPEFGMWAHLAAHERTRAALGTGLAELRQQLERISSHRTADRRRTELAAVYRAALDRPVLRAAEVPQSLRLPTLQEGYVPPRGRIALADSEGTPSAERWWEEQPLLGDLQPFLAAHLVHPDATRRPTVVLGHPGSGKSKFTEVLAAQLPPADFVAIRVELRTVDPTSPLHLQIEQGLSGALNTSVPWRDLAESADGALPVIILDGFDELLQATGTDRSDYLERVQEFQQQQESLGQPVAVVVTSRTVVANRTRFPLGTTVVRLEPFDQAQIEHMLRVWNRWNTPALSPATRRPLDGDTLMRYRELAEQPLLLMMLLIYDASERSLAEADSSLSHSELYERLLTMFARREVDKHHSGLSEGGHADAVEEELRRLEVTALAMFTRHRQSVNAEELGQDLGALMPGSEPGGATQRTGQADLHGRIAPAVQVLGRFFFVHEARARLTDGTTSVFEFLHATFGEYLVARAVDGALGELVAERARPSRRRGRSRAGRPDDGELFALSSFASYAGRQKVVEFLAELLNARLGNDETTREDHAELLIELFREAPFPAANRSYTGYEPARLPMTRREANYTSNLVILLGLVRRGPVDIGELYGDADPDPLRSWQATAALWRTLPRPEWFSILETLRVRHLPSAEAESEFTTSVQLEDGEPVNVGECLGFELHTDVEGPPEVIDPYTIRVPFPTTTSRLLRSLALRVNGTAARIAVSLLPYLGYTSSDLGEWLYESSSPGHAVTWTKTHEVLRLRLAPPDEGASARLEGYHRLLWRNLFLGRLELVVLRQAVEDLGYWARTHDEASQGKLLSVLEAYFQNMQSVDPDPKERPGLVERVLDDLEPYMTKEAVGRVRRLLHSTDSGMHLPPAPRGPERGISRVAAVTPWDSAGFTRPDPQDMPPGSG